jgi:hypothetical protein
MAGQTGTKHKIPEQHWTEIYQLYASGISVPKIHDKVRHEWKIDVSIKTVYSLVNELRDEKRKLLNEILAADTDDDLGRLKWLQTELEQVAVEVRQDDKPLFLKVADRLLKVYELKLNLRAHQAPTYNAQTDNGRAELIKELASHIVITNANNIS